MAFEPASTGLSVAGLKLRMDVTRSANDEVLLGYLEAAFEQAQAPWPDGTGRLLVSDPALAFVPDDPQPDPAPEGGPVGHYEDTADPVTRSYELGGRRRVVVPDLRFIADDGVVQDGTAVPASALGAVGYEVLRHQGHVVQISIPEGSWGELSVTGRFGFATVPPLLREAIYVLAARMWHERAALQADQAPAGDGAVQTYFRQLPARVRTAFSAYKLPGGVAGA